MASNNSDLNLLEEATKSREPVYLHGDKLEVSFQTTIETLRDRQLALYNSVPPDFIRDLMASQNFYLQIQGLKLQAKTLASDGEHLLFPFRPEGLVQAASNQEIRQERRQIFSPTQRAICEILNPYDRETWLKKTILDLSPSGMSIRCPIRSQLFLTGTPLPELRILIDDRLQAKHQGEVIYSRTLISLKGESSLQVGIKFL